MKYIKSFESTIEEDLKTYIICKNENIYIVLEILKKITNSLINVRKIIINKDGITIGEFDELCSNEYTTSIKGTKDRMVFQSDNIDEIKNQLELILYTKKYNL